ncbi:NACHT domain-containing protein [Lentzea sp. NPDC051838]|uniref:NACHT domain-containing protein n=1 Tax=Lentzea sp. NPDC051838 TaxID=3154849 RepID=UPI003419BC7C
MAQDLGPVSDPLKVLIDALKAFLSPGTTTIVVAVIVVLVLFKYFGLGKQIGTAYRWLTTRTDKRRAARRARFADHVESQMRRLGEKEEWRDHRYAELEAELEITGRQRPRLLRRTPMNSLKRVPSLSKALEEHEDRIVLLEGEPGAGKSVAMRHLTQRMAGRAMRRPSEHSVIPIYVNLKTFEPPGTPTAEDVRAFVIESINAVRDRDVERFLEEEFDRGMRDGTWLFLFDSFDEIPEILSATSANHAIEAYADAVHAFLHAMNACRGVVASREFRGPGRAAWPTFRVVPLSEQRKRLLVQRSELDRAVEDQLLGELPNAEVSVQQMSGNPLFLGLLCEHMRQGNDFPTNVHAVLETYIGHRLARDAERLRGHFDVGSDDVRRIAEELAFLIASRQSLGLNVPKVQAVALLAESLRRPKADLARTLDALIYTKIARTGDDEGSVTFSHRRLQEYFATCVVIREPDRVPVHDLLTSGRWRETAVTVLQTQRADHAGKLLEEAVRLLPSEVPGTGDRGYDWPPGLLYLLGILAEGGSPTLLATQPEVARLVGPVLKKAWEDGMLFDRKWVLEVCSVADTDTSRELLIEGFASDSEWLRQESFQQMRKLPQLAVELRDQIRQMLVDLSVGGKLRRERKAVLAQVRRLPDPGVFERAQRLLIFGPFLHTAVTLVATVLIARFSVVLPSFEWLLVVLYFLISTHYFLVVRMVACSESRMTARFQAFSSVLRDTDLYLLMSIPYMGNMVLTVALVIGAWQGGPAAGGVVTVFALLVYLLPIVLLFTAKYGWQGMVRASLNVLSPKAVLQALLFVAGYAVVLALVAGGAYAVEGAGLDPVVGEIAVTVFIALLALAVLFWVMSVVASRRMQRRQLEAMKLRLDQGDFSADMLRDHLFDLRTSYAAYATFAELHLREVRWPDELIAFLHLLAKALGSRNNADFDAVEMPTAVRKRAWVGSTEVLDQLSIFLGAQRRKAEATPR